jgi:hypothetical protein
LEQVKRSPEEEKIILKWNFEFHTVVVNVVCKEICDEPYLGEDPH